MCLKNICIAFILNCCSLPVYAVNVDQFVAAYQKKQTDILLTYLQQYQGTAVYPYILVRLLDERVTKQAQVTPAVNSLFLEYTSSLASQKLRIGYLKYWAEKQNWKNYTYYIRSVNTAAAGDDSEFNCSAVNYLSFKNKPFTAYLDKTLDGINKVSENCLKTLSIALDHNYDTSKVLHKVLELASTANTKERMLLREKLLKWPDSLIKDTILQGLSVIERARASKNNFTTTAVESAYLPYIAVVFTQAHNQRANDLFVKYKVYGTKAAPLALDWMARSAIYTHNWQGLYNTILVMEKNQKEKSIWRYWLAVAMQHMNKQQDAYVLLTQLSSMTDYYGWLARQQTHIGMPVENPGLAKELVPRTDISLRDQKNIAIQQLNNAGLWVEAAQEMNLRYKNANSQQLWLAANLANRMGLIERQVSYAERSGVLEWQIRFPNPYRAIVAKEAQQFGVNPALITAVMRQESRFMPHAYSSVGATGLMQLMPDTARSVATSLELGSKVNTAYLFQPALNIRLGTAYLRMLKGDGLRNVEVIASYNAGIGRVKQWNKNLSHLQKEEWVELIPFDETRNYVKNVLSNQAYYQYLADNQQVNFLTLY